MKARILLAQVGLGISAAARLKAYVGKSEPKFSRKSDLNMAMPYDHSFKPIPLPPLGQIPQILVAGDGVVVGVAV
ncbi:hypothetical protein [Corynebacterium glucuronolyticum]|uniref:hypothetical protein n=1 Tax=Corynebacterium glucuronolyticum TaxID=39791 RepID=UPI00223BF618|nr:hypothetical protein [Corynebacterium glucuronolyticum]MCT1563165.1 hypothetical protein [Corynebacterium glucuronolyticum]